MEKLAQRNREKVIDLLSERLFFERSSVALYDCLLGKVKSSSDPIVLAVLDDLTEHREQEKEHEEWIESQIRALGGDAHAETDRTRLAATESKGIDEIMKADPEISHLFHALLAAELVDNSGWELLVELADEANDVEARRELKKRLHQEMDHLALARRAVERLSRGEILGAAVPLTPPS